MTVGRPAAFTPGQPLAEDVLAKADRLFQGQKWAEARTTYDAALQREKDPHSATSRRALRGTVTCSLKLGDWDDAFDHVCKFRKRAVAKLHERDGWRPEQKKVDREARQAVEHFELMRELLGELSDQLTADSKLATPQRRSELTAERITVDFAIVTCVLDEGFDTKFSWYSSANWWWEVPGKPDAGDDEWDRTRDHRDRGIPLGPNGQLRFVGTPARYAADAVPGSKVLFLLKEIEQLDASPTKDRAAEALLKRASVARKLYGPGSEYTWHNAEFYYRLEQRPSFQSSYRGGAIKPFWELADDEARTEVEGRVRVVRLPAEESPLALLRLLEQQYPQSAAVPEAIYVRGLYYQSRQQFAKALEAYEVIRRTYPKHRRSADAKEQIERIRHADVLLGATEFQPAGVEPSLWFAHRQTEKVEFTARPLDLPRYLRDVSKNGSEPWELRFLGHNFVPDPRWSGETEREKKLAAYLGDKVTRWSESMTKAERVTTQATRAPLSAVGAYLVEARVPGRDLPSRALLVLTDIVIVSRQLPTKSLLYVADAGTGRPIADQDVHCHVEARPAWRSTTHRTNADGVIEEAFKTEDDVIATAVSKNGGVAIAELRPYYRDRADKEPESVYYAITDRPVYRPNSVVQFRVWTRDLVDRTYRQPQPNCRVRVSILGADDNGAYSKPVNTLELRTDKFGCVTGSYALNPEAALGEYALAIDTGRNGYQERVGTFRVEMYKKPEFEVTVEPADKLIRPGGKVRARIKARYYFGGPVAGAQVRYQVLREDYERESPAAQEFDWLYGAGYGQYAYQYPWLTSQKDGSEGFADLDDWRWFYRRSRDGADPVRRGETRLNADGTAEIEIDSADLPAWPGERDHRFIIAAEVRDESRRTIKGRGYVLAARCELAASATLDRGWYGPNSEAVLEVLLRGTNGEGTAAKGTVRLERITYSRKRDREAQIETLRTWEIQTDASGRLVQRLPLASEGQYRAVFRTRDSRNEPVEASAVFWVHGPKFDGSAYRYADLEIIPDRHSYKVGDTAHLLVHVGRPNGRVLWGDHFDSLWMDGYRFLDVPAHAVVIDVLVQARHVPNFFVAAALVGDGRVHTEKCELFVPPVMDLLNVRIKTDKDRYRPGEGGTVLVSVSDAAGKPVSGQLTLTAYDKAVTYIQGETAPTPALKFEQQRIGRGPDRDWMSFTTTVAARGKFLCPEFEIHDGGHPGICLGGSPPQGGDPSDTAARGSRAGRPQRGGGREGGRSGDEFIDPEVRRNFADTALWRAALELGTDGTTSAQLPWPDSLTTWRLRAFALTNVTQIGDAAAEVTTAKNLLVRLQTPRFLVEGDELVLSANVHNGLKKDKAATAELIVPAALIASQGNAPPADDAGSLHVQTQAIVKADGTYRFDWPVKVLRGGEATITVKALTDEESDAMQVAIPILKHGINKELAKSGSFRAAEEGAQTVTITVPKSVDPGETRLEVAVSSGPAGVMLDALPMLAGYPYGCTEQTMSRFYPTIIAAETLKRLGTNLEAVAKGRQDNQKNNRRLPRSGTALVSDSTELRRMAEAGLQRLYNFQHADGGWGWWQNDASSTYMTAYVLMGLQTTRRAGVDVRANVIERGYDYLLETIVSESRERFGRGAAEQPETRAFVAYVLALEPFKASESDTADNRASRRAQVRQHRDRLFRQRAGLNSYGRALLALALHHAKEPEQAKQVLGGLLDGVQQDDEKGTAWMRTPANAGGRWWNSDTEINAWALRALVQIDPSNELGPKLVNHLLANRPGGRYWHSTRDTALVIAALAEYLTVQKAAVAECQVTIRIDGRIAKEFTLTRDNFLTLDQRLVLDGAELPSGKHEVTFHKTGRGELHYGCRMRYFAVEDVLKAEGKGLAIQREYYRLGPKRERIAEGGSVSIGDVIEAVLTIKAENDYEYLAFEEAKPAGFEAVQLQSGGLWLDGHWVNVEFRDDKVVFFLPYLDRGERVLRYRLRAESAGWFRALPASGFAMYTPEIRATSGEQCFRVQD
jgi:uncharacterized protein YfaS (alpha-2-macroglobulin family)